MSQNSDFKHDSGFCAESSFCSNQKRKIKVKAFRPAQSIQCLTHLYPCTCIGQYSFLSNYALGYNLCSHVSNPYNSGAPAPNLRVTLIFNQNSTSGLWKKKTLPMQDRAFFFIPNAAYQDTLSQRETVIQSMFTLKSDPVKFLLCLDTPATTMIRHVRAHVDCTEQRVLL